MIDYTLKRSSRSRSIRIRVENSGNVIVTAPKLIPQLMIQRFVTKSSPWIAKQKRRLELNKQHSEVLNWQQMNLLYLGKRYKLKQVFENQGSKVIVGDKTILIKPITPDPKHFKKTLLSWLKSESEKYIRERTKYWSQQMNVRYDRIRFRQQKSRWGSCSSRGTLSFNWRLIHFDPEIIDYVIIHELAHTVQMNHSVKFWNLVKQYSPDYKSRVKFLRQQVVEMEKI